MVVLRTNRVGMTSENTDITLNPIPYSEINSRIGGIFPDSVVLNGRFEIITMSQNILDALGYSLEFLKGKSVSALTKGFDFREKIESKLQSGYFVEDQFEITAASGQSVLFGVSGFYLGLIAEIDDVIILKFRNLDEINLMYNRLEMKTAELDRFVYHSAHSLRGPLATIKGLINLAKLATDPEEFKFLVTQMDVFAEKLDDKLYRLIYFAEADKASETPVNGMSFCDLSNQLKKFFNEINIGGSITLDCDVSKDTTILNNGSMVLSLLRNLIAFFAGRPDRAPGCEMGVHAHTGPSATEFTLRVKGFFLDKDVQEKLINANFGYSEILNYQELINFYAAKKIVFKLRGTLHFTVLSSDEVFISMAIPTDGESLLH
jgi:light-regulated signal transduction histidine kinase (bacteriophytochrome)